MRRLCQLFHVLEWYIDYQRTEASDDKRRDIEESREWDSRATGIATAVHWPCSLVGADGTQFQLAESSGKVLVLGLLLGE